MSVKNNLEYNDRAYSPHYPRQGHLSGNIHEHCRACQTLRCDSSSFKLKLPLSYREGRPQSYKIHKVTQLL